MERRSHHRLVVGAEQPEVADVDGVVTGVGESRGDGVGNALVDQELHAPRWSSTSRSSTRAEA